MGSDAPDGAAVTGSRQGWLLRDGKVLASLEIPDRPTLRARGLIGRDGIEGAMLFRRCRSVHSIGMRFGLDVAFLDGDDVVIRTVRLHRWRVTMPVPHARSVLEAESGAFERWGLAVGDQLEICE
jgi:uncharacterized membrane protein (UPF0127 family)